MQRTQRMQHVVRVPVPITLAGVLALALLLSGFACNQSTTKRLAVASDAVAHSLADAQQAAQLAVQQGVITQADMDGLNLYFVQVSLAGQELDKAIRAGMTADTVSQKVNLFLDAFNKLQTSGLVGIKNPQLKLAISTALTAAEASVAVIAAAVGGGK